MQTLYACCCGLDVHKRFVVACLITFGKDGKHRKELQRFNALTPDLLRLIDWLQAADCTHVALESTGVCWKPIFNLMDGLFEIVLVNAQHMKAVPVRKVRREVAEKNCSRECQSFQGACCSTGSTLERRSGKATTRSRSPLTTTLSRNVA